MNVEGPGIIEDLESDLKKLRIKTQGVRTSDKSELINSSNLPQKTKELPIHIFTKPRDSKPFMFKEVNSPIFAPAGFKSSRNTASNRNKVKRALFLKSEMTKNNQYINDKIDELNDKIKVLSIETEF